MVTTIDTGRKYLRLFTDYQIANLQQNGLSSEQSGSKNPFACFFNQQTKKLLLISELYENNSDIAFGLNEDIDGHITLGEVSLSELHENAHWLTNIRSFTPKFPINVYEYVALVTGHIITDTAGYEEFFEEAVKRFRP